MIGIILRDYYKAQEKVDIVLLVLLVLIFTPFLTFMFPRLSENFVTALIASFSIFIGFLFNLLLMLTNMVKEINLEHGEPQSRKEFKQLKLDVIKKCLMIISASILFSVINIISMLFNSCDWSNIFTFIQRTNIFVIVAETIFIGATYFFILLFVHSLYCILKITHILLQKEIELKNKELSR